MRVYALAVCAVASRPDLAAQLRGSPERQLFAW